MSAEFVKLAPDMVRSIKGFTVVFHPPAGVDYSDASSGKIQVGTELFQKPTRRHVLYSNSKDLQSMTSTRADEILANVKRAMEFLGRPAEIYNGE